MTKSISFDPNYTLPECFFASVSGHDRSKPITAKVTERCNAETDGRDMILVSFSRTMDSVPDIFRRELTKSGTRRKGGYDGAIVYLDADDHRDIFLR